MACSRMLSEFRFDALARSHTYIFRNGSNSLLRVRQRNQLVSNRLSFVRGSAAIGRNSATAGDACAPSVSAETVFVRVSRGLNRRSVCLADSGSAISAEPPVVSSGVANARDCGIAEFAADPNGRAKLTQSRSYADSECGIGCAEFAAGRNCRAKLSPRCRDGNADCGIGYDEFAAGRNGFGKFAKPHRCGDPVRFRCICGDCTAGWGHIPSRRRPAGRLSQCPRRSWAELSDGDET
jgi:hypothetical protein